MTKSPFVRELRLYDAVAIVVGCIIGAGIFRVPSAIANHLEAPSVILLTWVFGGLLSIAGALCYAELSSLFPKTGGDYVYLRETYGHLVSFLFGWTKLFVERTGTIAIIAFVFSEYWSYLFAIPKEAVKLVAVVAILILTMANLMGLKYGKNIQNIFTSLKVLALASIILLGLLFLPREMHQGRISPLAGGMPFSFSLIQSSSHRRSSRTAQWSLRRSRGGVSLASSLSARCSRETVPRGARARQRRAEWGAPRSSCPDTSRASASRTPCARLSSRCTRP